MEALEELAGGFARGAVHELLGEGSYRPGSVAGMLAKAALPAQRGYIVWFDTDRRLYPLALAALGIDLSRLILLRPERPGEQVWAVAECLRCKGVAAVVAALDRLSRVEARRLQLAAEAGGSTGILLRPMGRVSREYAAATRWLVRPKAGQRSMQCWELQLIHGHGGRIGQSIILEADRETDHVRAYAPVADRPVEAKPAMRIGA
jgi:protein ImuA